MTGAHQLLETFLAQCKSGNWGELRLTCEGGHLKASMFADLGLLSPEVTPKSDEFGNYGGRVSPSRTRRRVKRAAERQLFTGVDKTIAEKAREADQVATAGKAATEEVVAGNVAAKEVVAENAASSKDSVEDTAAAKAAESDVKNTAAVSEMTAIEAAEAVVEKADCDTETASTSTKLMNPDQSCWNCKAAFTPAHQCDGSPEPVSKASPAPKPPDPAVNNVDPGRTFAPRRGLNINTFCVKCEERHPVRQKCQRQPVPPL